MISLTLIKCGSDDNGDNSNTPVTDQNCEKTITPQVSQGKFNGVDYTITKGSIRLINQTIPSFRLYLDIDDIDGDPCDFNSNILSIGFGAGLNFETSSTELSNETTISFITEGIEETLVLAATCGNITIQQITDTEVTVGLAAKYNESHTINGNFTVKRCN